LPWDDAKVRELGITPRELEILNLIARGMSNREIAGPLFVSENTVKTHSARLFDKLDVNRRSQLTFSTLRPGVHRVPIA
jgi:ATP/maltotriose-dependent transcriptional regulator MalT